MPETHTARTLAEHIMQTTPHDPLAVRLARLVIAEANAGTEVMPGVTLTAYASTVHRGLNVDIDAPEGVPVTVHLNDGRVVREVVGYDPDETFDRVLTRFGLADTDGVYEIQEGAHGSADWRESPDGMPTTAKLIKTMTRVHEADDWALGALHTGEADEVWARVVGSEFHLYAWQD